MQLRRILFVDADDTLWDNQTHHDAADEAFLNLAEAAGLERDEALVKLHDVHHEVMARSGVGPHTHLESILETWRRHIGVLDAAKLRHLETGFQTVLEGHRTLLPGVGEVMSRLAERHWTILLTRGIRDHQIEKLERSGLSHHFRAVHVVADKTPQLFRELATALSVETGECAMIGNSAAHDIAPALEAGCYGVHIPFALEAHFDRGVDTQLSSHPRLRRLASFRDLAGLIA